MKVPTVDEALIEDETWEKTDASWNDIEVQSLAEMPFDGALEELLKRQSNNLDTRLFLVMEPSFDSQDPRIFAFDIERILTSRSSNDEGNRVEDKINRLRKNTIFKHQIIDVFELEEEGNRNVKTQLQSEFGLKEEGNGIYTN